MFKPLTVKDQLAAVISDVDQAQATIDEARRNFPDDPHFQRQLDDAQHQLDQKIERIKLIRTIANIVEK